MREIVHILCRDLRRELEVLSLVSVLVEEASPVVVDLLPVAVALLEDFEVAGLEPWELCQFRLVPVALLLALLSEVL